MKKFSYFLIMFVFFLSVNAAAEEESKQEQKPQVKFYRLYPDFITNLAWVDGPVFLQVRVEVMVANDKQVKLLEKHEPQLQDKILQLFNGMSSAQWQSLKEKKATQKKVLAIINQVLKKEEGKDFAQQVSFTKLIIE